MTFLWVVVFFTALDRYLSWLNYRAEKKLRPYDERDYYECLDLIYDGRPPLDEIEQKRSDELLGKEKPVETPKEMRDKEYEKAVDAHKKEKNHRRFEPGLLAEFDLKNHRAFCMDCLSWIPLSEAPKHVHRVGEYTDN